MHDTYAINAQMHLSILETWNDEVEQLHAVIWNQNIQEKLLKTHLNWSRNQNQP